MLKGNWYYFFGVFFLIVGVVFLFTASWIDAAWAICLGAINFFAGYGHQYPERVKGLVGWIIGLPLTVAILVLTIIRLRLR